MRHVRYSALTIFFVLVSVVFFLPVNAPGQERYTPKLREVPVPPPVELPVPPDSLPQVTQKPLTSIEAVRIALIHQANISAAMAEIETSQGNTMQVKAGQNPTFSMNANYNGVTAPSGSVTGSSASTSGGGLSILQNLPVTPLSTSTGGSAPGYQLNATIRKLIYDFNHTINSVRQAMAQEKASLANLTRVQLDTVYNVKNAFYTYIQRLRLVNVNMQNVSTQQKHLEMAQELWKAGTGLPSDVLRAETAVQSAIFNLTQARSDAQIAQINLAVQMGIDPRTPIKVSEAPEPEFSFGSIEKLFDIALVQRPEMKQALANVSASLYGLEAAYSNDAPAFTGQAGWISRGSEMPPATSYFNTGLVMQWYLYDGNNTTGMIKSAQGSLKTARAQLELTKQNVLQDVAAAAVNLKTASQKIVTAEAEVANAEETARLIDGRYRAGMGTFLDVLDAQQALLTAKINSVNSQSTLDIARAALSHAIGNPLPKN